MKTSLTRFHRFPRDRQMALSSAQIMHHVCYAMIPGLLLQIFFYGPGVLIQGALAVTTAILCEALNAKLRRRRLGLLESSSALVTAMILVASIPATAPWWLIITGTALGLLLAKHAFGGVGMNIFNPAIVGFCIVYLSFSAEMNTWPLGYVGFSDSWTYIFSEIGKSHAIDSLTGATQLASLKANGIATQTTLAHWWINIAWLIGGLYLWLRQIADWRLSTTFLGIFIILTILFNQFGSPVISTIQHIGLGALVFTACFIISDPATAATSRLGRLIYAALAAIIAVIIRQYSNMPDSMAFSILLVNLAAPMIDNYTRPEYVRN